MPNVLHNDDAVALLQAAAAATCLARIRYLKHPTLEKNPWRTVEPYGFTQGKQDMMIRCHQIDPEDGWRFFMVHKIAEVDVTKEKFVPRVRVTMPTGQVHTPFGNDVEAPWSDRVQRYRDAVSDALADGTVSPDELTELRRLIESSGITQGEREFVHVSLYHRCLGAVLDDKVIDVEEKMQLRFLHRVMGHLGWSIGEVGAPASR